MRFALAVMLWLPLVGLADSCDWPLWQQFKRDYLVDSRVIDDSDARRITTSEGQSYGMFFALVANDKAAFAELLEWTEQHLAEGDLTGQLPAWLWGRDAHGQWQILDPNSASDADVWIAYSLAEAGRLWGNHRYASLGYLLARRIIAEETAVDAKGRRHLLPGSIGFRKGADRFRLNPSYLTLQLFDGLASHYPVQPWMEVAGGGLSVLRGSARGGLLPDWVTVENGAVVASAADSTGSYDAIRTYLWTGMLHPRHSARASLLASQRGLIAALEAGRPAPPERVNVATGAVSGEGPFGFSAALLPMLSALDKPELLKAQQQRALKGAAAAPAGGAYYNQMLSLFGLGWLDKRYRFALDGRLQPGWEASECG